MGGGVVKGLILQGFASSCMSWCGCEMVMLHFKQNISKHNVICLTRHVRSSMILTLCLESEQHTTDQNTTFSAEMLFLSKNALFLV